MTLPKEFLREKSAHKAGINHSWWAWIGQENDSDWNNEEDRKCKARSLHKDLAREFWTVIAYNNRSYLNNSDPESVIGSGELIEFHKVVVNLKELKTIRNTKTYVVSRNDFFFLFTLLVRFCLPFETIFLFGRLILIFSGWFLRLFFIISRVDCIFIVWIPRLLCSWLFVFLFFFTFVSG
jgi:hypothetical protein